MFPLFQTLRDSAFKTSNNYLKNLWMKVHEYFGVVGEYVQARQWRIKWSVYVT